MSKEGIHFANVSISREICGDIGQNTINQSDLNCRVKAVLNGG